MDFQGISSISVAFDNLSDLLAGRTGNPMAEGEIPEMLKKAIKAGVQVRVTDPEDQHVYDLGLDGNDKFVFGPAHR